jgi:hypothetical protein
VLVRVYGVTRGSEGAETDKANSGARNEMERHTKQGDSHVSGIDGSAVGASDRDWWGELGGLSEITDVVGAVEGGTGIE